MNSVTDTLPPEAFDELDTLLDELRTRLDETPQWEFCEGFIAALICCRREISPTEYWPVLLDIEAGSDELAARFLALWAQRWSEVAAAVDKPVDNLGDVRFRIDYIFHSAHFKAVSADVRECPSSDHHLLLAELKWKVP